VKLGQYWTARKAIVSGDAGKSVVCRPIRSSARPVVGRSHPCESTRVGRLPLGLTPDT
jgi:hypothetical protein